MEVKVTDANFKEEVLDSKLPVLVDFWADWCGPCLMVTPIVKEIAEEYKGKLKVCKLNVDEGHNTASRYDIASIPTLAVFKNGSVADKIVGAVPKAELKKLIKPHL